MFYSMDYFTPVAAITSVVNTLITNTEMATLILRKVMGFCASAAKLVPNSSPLNPNLKGHLPLSLPS